MIGDGTIVPVRATADAAEVGELCLVASNAPVNRGAAAPDRCRIGCGGMVRKDARVPELTTVESGAVYRSLLS